MEFESSFRRHLMVEQRRAVLEAVADRLGPSVTMGDVLDAADGLGWGDSMGDLTLADLAAALLDPSGPRVESAPMIEVEPPPKPAAAAAPAPAPTRASASGKRKADGKPEKKAPEPEPEPEPPRVVKPGKKMTAKAKSAKLRALRARIDADDRMSLEEAAELLVPIIGELAQATMQDLEDFTGIGRRKLRFHIGQLVRHDHLARHGMGRGTYYTVCE